MGIISINNAMGASYGAYNQKLTQKTKEQLDANGIVYNSNITEMEGRKLLQTQAAQKSMHDGSSQNNASDLYKRALELAKKLGIAVNPGISFEQLLALIEVTLEERINSNKNNIEALQALKGLSQELANIQSQSKGSSGYDNTNQALMQSLEMLSEYNKNFLNKNQK